MKNRKFEFVPLCMLGYTFTLPADKILFNRLGEVETLTFTGTHWVYQTGKVNVPISDHSEMDAILLGWYTAFDGAHASVTIKVRTYVDKEYTWVQYKN
ncbi:MAG: hypothetical protein J5614_06260 [Paludibacteraceae bacterium]|nr:hypothetical protein [Paludibacteraceae bacterium]